MKFPEKLKYERELRGWSQAKMAEELATTPNRISTWERGLALPSAYFRAKLCTLLATNAEELGLLPAHQSIDSALSLSPTLPSSNSDNADEPDLLPIHQNVDSASLLSLTLPSSLIKNASMRKLSASRRALYLFGTLTLVILLLCGIYITTMTNWLHPASASPYPPYAGQIVLNDSLHEQNNAMSWQEGINDVQARCLFKNGAYTAYIPLTGRFHACIAQLSDYKNFTYEVEMTIHSGEFAGIVFRSENSIDSHFYLFRVYTDGSYELFRFTDRTIEHAIALDQGTSPYFKQGSGQFNLIAVTAQDDLLTLYLNRKYVSSIRDSGYTHGQIGVLAGSLNHSPAEASFKNAKVWIL